MPTAAELRIDQHAALRVVPSDPQLSFLCDLAQAGFQVGRFRAPRGAVNNWLLDCRAPMSDGGTARELGRHFLRLAEQDNISQFAGRGFGAYLLVGAILGCGGSSVRGALLRPEIKRHGRQRIIEGDLDPTRPVCVVDDILNSGQSACEAVHVLRKAGFQQLSYQCIFRFAWGDGRTRLERAGVASRWLATINRDLQGRAPSSSRTTGDSFFQRWRIWRR